MIYEVDPRKSKSKVPAQSAAAPIHQHPLTFERINFEDV